MIRREIELEEGERLWLLVSQVDHAHISGELTRQGVEHFSSEVIEAITHHDDGWATWEESPKLHPETGTPYSFLEMPLPESLAIWDQSIAAARKIGPLAGFIVAGHFYNLLSASEHREEAGAIAWLSAKRKSRTAWLDEWVRSNPEHTLDAAKQAQEQLLTADLFSLWLCCDAPMAGDEVSILGESQMRPLTEKLFQKYRFKSVGFGRRHATPDNPQEALAWVIAVEPFAFTSPMLSFSLAADVVPVARYSSWNELKSASRQIELRWRLIPPQPAAPAQDNRDT
jgi:hypothetical protein